MNFAALATVAVALAVAPLAGKMIAPSMTDAQFMQAAECFAYATLPQSNDATKAAELRAELAFAQHDQRSETVAAARDHIHAIRAHATETDAATLENARNHACSGVDSMVAQGGGNPPAA